MKDRETKKLGWAVPSLVELTKSNRKAAGVAEAICSPGVGAVECFTGYGASWCGPGGGVQPPSPP